MPVGLSLAVLPSDLLTANHAAPKYTPGIFAYDAGGVITGGTDNVFQYVQVTIGVTTACTLVPGRPVYYDSKQKGTTKTDNGGTDKMFAGFLLTNVTSTYYTWIQVKGNAWGITSAALAIETLVIAGATSGSSNNGKVITVTAGGNVSATEFVVGRMLAAGAAVMGGGASGTAADQSLIGGGYAVATLGIGSSRGTITSIDITVLNGFSGIGVYNTVAPTITIVPTGGDKPATTATATTVISSPGIGTFTITNAGVGYRNPPRIMIGLSNIELFGVQC